MAHQVYGRSRIDLCVTIMDKMAYQAPRGTYDLLPATAAKWRSAESRFVEWVEKFGYGEIRTPMFEDSELFIRSSGEESEVVSKQMYRFKDMGDRDLCLKPEGTAPAIRAYLEHQMGQTGDVTRLWYFTHIFRYERPQKGRNRQAHQLGLELIGSPSPEADAEIIEITMGFYQLMGLRSAKLKLNSIGRTATRQLFKEQLLKFAEPYLATLESEARAKAEKNPMRLLDSKDPAAIDHFVSAPSIQDALEPESRAHFERVQELLHDAGVAFEVDPRIVRGLDYYSDTVFEVTSDALGAQSSLCGGGRYDGLVKQLGGPEVPCVGVGCGVERLHLVLEAEGLDHVTRPNPIFLVAATDSARQPIRELARRLRQQGWVVLYDLDGANMKRQMKLADRASSRWALIVGDDELQQQAVTARNLADSQQTLVPMEGLPEWLTNQLG